MSYSKILGVLVDMSFGGVDFSLPGSGGANCVIYLSPERRVLETVGYVIFNCALLFVAIKKCQLPSKFPPCRQKDDFNRKILLVFLCLVFGIELGYKLSTKQLIFLLNPCHILTVTQIVLLCLPQNSKLTMVIFRLHIHMLFGAFLAILFPVVNSRVLPFEVANYWNQHIFIFFIVPPYLLTIGGSFTTEELTDFSWCAVMSAFYCFFMFLFLQPLGLASHVNLNNMICPAISDPFGGKNYRVWAMIHQQVLVLTFGKIYTLVVNCILSKVQRQQKKNN